MQIKQDLVLYDGKCSFCSFLSESLKKIDFKKNIIFLDLWQSKKIIKNYQLTEAQVRKEIHMIEQDGEVIRGYQVFKKICDKLTLLFPVRLILYVPFAEYLANKLYRFIATNRYKIFPCNGECPGSV